MSKMASAPDGSAWYRAAVYCGIAIMYMYREDISPYVPGETLGSFAERNEPVFRRVRDEMLSTFRYELSHRQMGAIVAGWLEPPNRIAGTDPYIPAELCPHSNVGDDGKCRSCQTQLLTPEMHSTGEENEG